MYKLPIAIRQLAEKFERLPGIGAKSAQRLALYLLHNPQTELDDFALKLSKLKKRTMLCQYCHQITDRDPCALCSDEQRDRKKLCIVEQPLDLIALEKADTYNGLYHVLHGSISPLQHIGPEQLYLRDLLNRLDGVEELILATNLTMEGEATALYIANMVAKVSTKIKITRIGHGLPTGADIEYADGLTLARALASRQLMTSN